MTKSRGVQKREGLTLSAEERAHDPRMLAFKRDIYTGFYRIHRSSLDS